MSRDTIIVYHSLEASGSSTDPSVRSQNLGGRFSASQHRSNAADRQAMNQSYLSGRGYPFDDSDAGRPGIADPLSPLSPAKNNPALSARNYQQQSGRVVDHVSVINGAADRRMASMDDTDLSRALNNLRSVPRTIHGRDADLTVAGEIDLADPSYAGGQGYGRAADALRGSASVWDSPNGKTSNSFSYADGYQNDGANFTSRANFVAGGQSYFVMEINQLVVGFTHTPNAKANTAGAATGFYSGILRHNPDIIMGDTNKKGNSGIAGFLGPSFVDYPRSLMLVCARPAGFQMTGTNSVRTEFYDQIAYNPDTVEIIAAHYIPSDVSGATMSDHFGLMLRARKKVPAATMSKRKSDMSDDGDHTQQKQRVG